MEEGLQYCSAYALNTYLYTGGFVCGTHGKETGL